MTKRIFIALALVAGATSGASAQVIAASATVENYVAQTGTTQDLTFGSLTPDGLADLTVDHTDVTQMGFVEYSYNASGYEVGVAVTGALSNGSETLSLTLACEDTDVAATPAALDVCTGLTLDHDGTGVDSRRVWVGGTLGDITVVSGGLYTGEITFTVTP